MKAHELARKLLEMPDYDVEVVAHGHRYHSYEQRRSHGPLEVLIAADTRWNTKAVPMVSIGDMLDYTFSVSETEILQAPLDNEEYVDRVRLRDEGARKLAEHNAECLRRFGDILKEHYAAAFANGEVKY